jgi:hypothetical protein
VDARLTPIEDLSLAEFSRVVDAIGWEQVASVAQTDEAIGKIAARLSERARCLLFDGVTVSSRVDHELAIALYRLTLEHLRTHGSNFASSTPSA